VEAIFAPKIPTIAVQVFAPRFHVAWTQSDGRGHLLVGGSLGREVTALIRLGRAGAGPVVVQRRKFDAGPFDFVLPVNDRAFRGGERVLPEPLVLSMTGRQKGLVLPLQLRTVLLRPPAAGFVRTAWLNGSKTAQRGVKRLPAG